MSNNQTITRKGQQQHQANDDDSLVPASSFSYTPLQAQQAVFAAIAALDDPALKCEFDTAAHHDAGCLVLQETPALDFLRREDGHVGRAAHRLVLYWKFRKMVFGEDRWLLPLTQTGRGALENSTIELIRSGVFTYIPGTTPVIVMDLSRCPPGKTSIGEDCWPWAFYMGTQCSNYVTNTRGVQLLHVLNKAHRIEFFPGLFEIMWTALPVKFLPQVLLVPEAEPYGEHILRDYLALQASRMVEYNRKKTPQLVNADSAAGRLRILQARGMPRHGLPTSVGGTFTPEHFENWIRLRLSKEDAMSAAPLVANAALVLSGQSMFRTMLRNTVGNTSDAATAADTPTTLPGVAVMNGNSSTSTTMTDRTTIASLSQQIVQFENDNDIHSEKRNRGRPKKTDQPATAAELMGQRDWCKEQNVKLRAENRKLMDSLAQARYLVAIHNTNDNAQNVMALPPPTLTAGAVPRTSTQLRNPVVAVPRSVEEYPEHKARVKKPTDTELLEQRDQWKELNNALRRDNQRLENLLERGRSIVAQYTNNSNNMSYRAAQI